MRKRNYEDDDLFRNYAAFQGEDGRMQELAVAGAVSGMIDDFEDFKRDENTH